MLLTLCGCVGDGQVTARLTGLGRLDGTCTRTLPPHRTHSCCLGAEVVLEQISRIPPATWWGSREDKEFSHGAVLAWPDTWL
jgi:hypothetical protein